MATPFVAGVALLMRDADAALTAQQVKEKIAASALDWARGGDNETAGSTGADTDYGAGRLDAYAALASAGATLTEPTAVPKHELYEGTLSATGAVVDYKLEVGETGSPIAATLVIPAISGAWASSPDFDLYLYDPAGTLARAETVYRQENVSHRPASTGTYTLRVRSYSGSGAYFVDLSAGLAVDTTAPTVASVSPEDGASGIAAGTNASVTFSEGMDKASAESAFSLVNASDGSAVAGTFSWAGETMAFDPSSELAAGASYTAKVTTAAKDSAGNALASEKSWTFTVAAASTKTSVSPSSVTIYYGSLRSGGLTSRRRRRLPRDQLDDVRHAAHRLVRPHVRPAQLARHPGGRLRGEELGELRPERLDLQLEEGTLGEAGRAQDRYVRVACVRGVVYTR